MKDLYKPYGIRKLLGTPLGAKVSRFIISATTQRDCRYSVGRLNVNTSHLTPLLLGGIRAAICYNMKGQYSFAVKNHVLTVYSKS